MMIWYVICYVANQIYNRTRPKDTGNVTMAAFHPICNAIQRENARSLSVSFRFDAAGRCMPKGHSQHGSWQPTFRATLSQTCPCCGNVGDPNGMIQLMLHNNAPHKRNIADLFPRLRWRRRKPAKLSILGTLSTPGHIINSKFSKDLRSATKGFKTIRMNHEYICDALSYRLACVVVRGV